VRLLTSAALVLLCLTGCRDHSNAYDATQVADALRAHGFEVGVSTAHDADFDKLLEEAFPSARHDDVVGIVSGRVPVDHSTPAAYTSNLLVEALIFKGADGLDCEIENVLGPCLGKRNVVVSVRRSRAKEAAAALDDLG